MRILLLSITSIILILSACRKEDPVRAIIGFVGEDRVITENIAEPLQIKLFIDRVNHEGGTLDLRIEGGKYGEVYTSSLGASESTIQIPAGVISETFTIDPVDNLVIGDDKSLDLTLTNSTGSLVIGDGFMSIDIVDDDAPVVAEVRFETDTIFVDENTSTNQIVRIDFNKSSVEAGTIDLTLSGTAVAGEDYKVGDLNDGKLTLNVNEGAAQARFNIEIVDNDEENEDKIIDIQITALSDFFEPGDRIKQVIVIRNDD